MKKYVIVWWIRLGRFLHGDSPIYTHRRLREQGAKAYNFVLMFLVYYLIVTTISIMLRLFHPPFLKMRIRKKSSYWKTRRNPNLADHERRY